MMASLVIDRAWLPALLVGLTLGRHHVVDFAALAFDNAQHARRALFYAAGGVVSASLYGLVWLLTPWRPAQARVGVALVCAWGILEESQVTICRIGLGLNQPAPPIHQWRGLCDQLSGVPISTMSLVLPVVIVYWLAGRKHE